MKAHVYDVVELHDGTRFLDVCGLETPDAECRFTVISLNQDRTDVGNLEKYRGKDIELCGRIHPHDQVSAIVLSNERQFHGGAEKFRPNLHC